VAWGIFMLIILLGFGNGMQNGVHEEFEGDAVNSIWVNGGKTSVAHNGMQPGRVIRFTNEDYDLIKKTITGVENVAARNHIWLPGNIVYKKESATFSVIACHPGYRHLERLEMLTGRFINEQDVQTTRKVAVLGSLVVERLFKDDEPLGKYISVDGLPFLVIGTFKDKGGDWDQKRLYIPMSTGQNVFGLVNSLQMIAMNTLDLDPESAREKEAQIRKILTTRHNVAPDDLAGIRINSPLEDYQMYNNMFASINLFVWAVGIMTLIAGIVGVGNVMTISVRERTREIGIRKAIGATPFSVISMIMQEAVVVTLISGLLGLFVGIAFLETGLLSKILESVATKFNLDLGFFSEPEVDFLTALGAAGLLILAGSIAGFIPAYKASAISPIAAIREE